VVAICSCLFTEEKLNTQHPWDSTLKYTTERAIPAYTCTSPYNMTSLENWLKAGHSTDIIAQNQAHFGEERTLHTPLARGSRLQQAYQHLHVHTLLASRQPSARSECCDRECVCLGTIIQYESNSEWLAHLYSFQDAPLWLGVYSILLTSDYGCLLLTMAACKYIKRTKVLKEVMLCSSGPIY
jgi:hypothetical protein